jgi:hypothetical protein
MGLSNLRWGGIVEGDGHFSACEILVEFCRRTRNNWYESVMNARQFEICGLGKEIE